MSRVFTILIFCAVVAGAALALPAQAQADDDGRLVRLIEDALSDGAARSVDLQGFRGALSSRAELDVLTIADADGVWLRIDGAVLDWTQSALLRGRLEVEALTAERVELLRLPVPEPSAPSPEAQAFALPELPVAITLGEVAIAELILGGDVLGERLRASATASLALAGGEGFARLDLSRLDADGAIRLEARYDNGSTEALVELAVHEGPGGLVAEALAIDGAPALALTLTGQGPVDGFSAAFALQSDGVDRLDGTARSLRNETGEIGYALALSGDMRPLLSGDLEAFLGPDTRLQAEAVRGANGAFRLDPFTLDTAALHLDGVLQLDPQNQPEAFELAGRLRPLAGADRLALPGAGDAEIAGASLQLGYDRAQSDRVAGVAVLDSLTAQGFAARATELVLNGALTADGFAGELRLDATDLAHADPEIARAMGAALRLATDVIWSEMGGLALSGLTLRTETAQLDGRLSAIPSENRLDIRAELAFATADLSPFGAVAGQPLSGAASGALEAELEALSGAFGAAFDLRADDLALPGTMPDGLLAGETTVGGRVLRDAQGLRLESLQLEGSELTLTAEGQMTSDSADLTAEARLRNASILSPALPGSIRATASVTRRDAGPYVVDMAATGPLGMTADVTGDVSPDALLDLRISGAAPLVLANPLIAPQTASGSARFDLAMVGPANLSALSGQVSVRNGRVGLPAQGLALNDLSARAELARGRAQLALQAALSSGGDLAVRGPVGFADPALPAQLEITLTDGRLTDPALYDARIDQLALTLSGNLAGRARLDGDILLGPVNLRVPDTSLAGPGAIPDISHQGESGAERLTRAYAGLLQQGGAGGGGDLQINIGVSAPGQVFLRGRGLDAELGGDVRVFGPAGDLRTSGGFELIRGRLEVLTQRFDLTEGRVTLQGDDPYIALTARTQAEDYTVFIQLEGIASAPEITLRSNPDLPEDEVLAQLFFGRSAANLSAIQALQLADGVAALAGGGSGVFTRLREGLGLDDLDISTDEGGNTAVRAGRYLSENVYTDVTVDSAGTGVSLNIDLSPSVTARGGVNSTGESSVGIFFERDY